MGEKVYLTRKAIAARAQQRGIPLTINTVNHDAHRGCGPRHVAEYAGKVRLYTLEEADTYIASKITPVVTEAAE
jgi:hypothetical protein